MREQNKTAAWWVMMGLITAAILILAPKIVKGQQCPDGSCWVASQPAVAGHETKPPGYVCRIRVPADQGAFFGTGVLVSVSEKYGYVVTNSHVIRDARGTPVCYFPSGFKSGARAKKIDTASDLAVLQIFRPRAKPVQLAAEVPRVGQHVIVGGFGSGSFRAVGGKLFSFFSSTQQPAGDLIGVRARTRDGDSGGPMLDERGYLIGILFGADRSGNAHGAHVGRIRTFLGWRDIDRQCLPIRPVVPVIRPRRPAGNTVDIRAEINVLKKLIAEIQLKPGPEGPPGPKGPQGEPGQPGVDGQNGVDGTTPDVSAINERLDEIEALANRPITVQVIRDGQVIQSEDVYLGGVLPLNLIPVGSASNGGHPSTE